MELKLTTKRDGRELTVSLNGEVNIMTAPELKALLDAELPETDSLLFDFSGCDSVSSAGLRVLLKTFKKIKARKGQMQILNIGPVFREVLDITGLDVVFGCK